MNRIVTFTLLLAVTFSTPLLAQRTAPHAADAADLSAPMELAPITAEARRADRSDLHFAAPRLTMQHRHDLGFLTTAERAVLAAKTQATKVGIVRALTVRADFTPRLTPSSNFEPQTSNPSSAGLFESTGAQTIWTTAIASSSADALRLHFRANGFSAGAIAYVYSGAGEVHGPYALDAIDAEGFWTNTVFASEVFVEVRLPANGGGTLTIDSVAHLEHELLRDDPHALGYECIMDAGCFSDANWAKLSTAIRGIAQLNFIDGGSGYICTGSLLNDKDTTTYAPYLLTANHCFSSQSAASSLEAYWHYRTASCFGVAPQKSTLPRTLGSTLLATGASSDFTFVRLSHLPSGVALLGWDANPNAVANGTRVWHLGHPKGMPVTYSEERQTDYPAFECNGRPFERYLYGIRSVGAVGPGSSGGPAIDVGDHVVGQLLGICGNAPDDPCGSQTNYVVDGWFGTTYGAIAPWLSPGGTAVTCTPGPTTACLLNKRFKATVRFRNAFDNGAANADASVKSVSGFSDPSYETAFFYFNSSNNIEMMVKMLDQGNTNSAGQPTIAVLFGTATPLRIELTLTDTKTGATKSYTSNFGSQAGQTDFTAFVK